MDDPDSLREVRVSPEVVIRGQAVAFDLYDVHLAPGGHGDHVVDADLPVVSHGVGEQVHHDRHYRYRD